MVTERELLETNTKEQLIDMILKERMTHTLFLQKQVDKDRKIINHIQQVTAFLKAQWDNQDCPLHNL